MNFKEALVILGIESYAERIMNSNSHGELFHLNDYLIIANHLEGTDHNFKEIFERNVKLAEDTWSRPESIFQHVGKMFGE